MALAGSTQIYRLWTLGESARWSQREGLHLNPRAVQKGKSTIPSFLDTHLFDQSQQLVGSTVIGVEIHILPINCISGTAVPGNGLDLLATGKGWASNAG